MCLPILCADCSDQYSKFRLLVNREINAVRALLLHGFTNPPNAPPLDAAMHCMMAMLSNSGRMHRMRYMNNYQWNNIARTVGASSSQVPTATATLITTPPSNTTTATTATVITPSAPSVTSSTQPSETSSVDPNDA